MRHDAESIRTHLQFDVTRLAEAARRLQSVDERLVGLKARLEMRAMQLGRQGREPAQDEQDEVPSLRTAQAHAIAHLARRAVLTDVLNSQAALPMIASMAVGRWVAALRKIAGETSRGERTVKFHVEAGRVACRILRTMRRRAALKSGVSRLVSAVVVAEFVHPDDAEWVDIEIEHGLFQARFARSISSAEQALAAASAILREAAELLERMATLGEPAVDALIDEAHDVERDVEARLCGH